MSCMMPGEMMPYSEKEITTFLRNIPIFQGLDDRDYREIIPLLTLERYRVADTIIKEGTSGDSMCILAKGAVKISKSAPSGEEIILELLYPGSYFGEFSLVDNMPRSASVACIEESEIFRLEKKDFDALLSRNPSISLAFYKNCLEVTFSRFRTIIANFAFTQHTLREKSSMLDEINRDLELASKIQNYFINRDLLDHEHSFLPGVRHAYLYRPCIEIGGDFVNVTEIGTGVAAIIVADIMGHGITSALGTGVLKSAYSLALKKNARTPVRLMQFINAHFLNVIPQLYATCYYALVDIKRKRMTLAKAGHPDPLFWKKSARAFVEIGCQGTGLGLVREAEFEQVSFPIEKGDAILFYTDGIIEQKNQAGEMYSEARLAGVFRGLIEAGETDIVNMIFNDLLAFAGDRPIDDDITILLLEF